MERIIIDILKSHSRISTTHANGYLTHAWIDDSYYKLMTAEIMELIKPKNNMDAMTKAYRIRDLVDQLQKAKQYKNLILPKPPGTSYRLVEMIDESTKGFPTLVRYDIPAEYVPQLVAVFEKISADIEKELMELL